MQDDNSLDSSTISIDPNELLRVLGRDPGAKHKSLTELLGEFTKFEGDKAARLHQRALELQSLSEVIAKESAPRDKLSAVEKDKLMRQAVQTLAGHIPATAGAPGTPGRPRRSAIVLQHLSPLVIAKLVLQTMLDRADGETPAQTIVTEIGRTLGTEIRLANLNRMTGQERAAAQEGISKARRKRRTNQQREQLIRELGKDEEAARKANDFYEFAIDVTGLFQRQQDKNKPKTLLLSVEKQAEIYAAHTQELLYVRPQHLPMVCRPLPWKDLYRGGYLTFKTTAMKVYPTNKWMKSHIKHLKSTAGRPQALFDTLNHLQNTGWTINEEVLWGMAKILRDFVDEDRTQKHRQRLARRQAKQQALQEAAGEEEADAEEDQGAGSEDSPDDEIIHDLHTFRFDQWVPALLSNITLASAYLKRGQPFYFVWQADFRGRCYPVGKSLGPQGHDSALGLLRFAEGKPLGGERGEYWFALHGANVLDRAELKGATFDEKITWVHKHSDDIIAAAADPLAALEFLGGDRENLKQFSDSVWQAFAFCEEWARWRKEGSSFLSYLPITVDGTCNAIQHLAALTRCEKLGEKVNLIDSVRKGDIYGLVAQRLLEFEKDHRENGIPPEESNKPSKPIDEEDFRNFQALLQSLEVDASAVINRSLCKTPVMCRPYGMSEFGIRGEIGKWFKASKLAAPYKAFDNLQRTSAITYLLRIMQKAFEEELTRAEVFMTWMQDVTKCVSALDRPIDWETYLKLPIRHARVERKETFELVSNIDKILKSNSNNKRRSKVFTADTDKIDDKRASNAVIANFVHGQDATHMMMTTLEARNAGINSLRMVHDSFATHACDMDKFSAIIRRTFVELYQEDDAVGRFYANCKRIVQEHGGQPSDIPDIPERGTLDVREVLDSRYFFS